MLLSLGNLSGVMDLSFSILSSGEGSLKKRVEDVMPIATGLQREELEADLEVLLCLFMSYGHL